MSTRRLCSDDDRKVESSFYGNKFKSPRQILGFRDHIQQSSMNSDKKIMTLERMGKRGDNKDNGYALTLPRRHNSHYAKFLSLSNFACSYFNKHTSHIQEEELTYLKAVESGDLETVENILKENGSADDSDCEGDKKLNGDGAVSNDKNDVFHDGSLGGFPTEIEAEKLPRSENEVIVEMVELDQSTPVEARSAPNKRTPVRTKFSSNKLWKKVKGTTPTPLPVTLTKDPSPRRTDSPYLKAKNSQNPSKPITFNRNCKDQWGRSAMFIAMLHQNVEMLELLLTYKVEIDECLYHAIDFGYYDIVELFMKYDKDTTQVITGEDSFYPPGLTPIQLAAHKNDYVMLKILHSHNFRITGQADKRDSSKKSKKSQADNKTVLEKAWDRSNNEILYYRAMASPAYLVMMFNEGFEGNTQKWDFLEEIFLLYRKLKKKASDEPTVRSLYLPLAEQVEEFACDLLSEARCSHDLVSLLRFDPPGQARMISQRSFLMPVHRAIEVRMKRFVAHDNSQLAISTLRLGTLFKQDHGWRTNMTRILLGLIFPILCLAFIVAPESKIGRLLRNPVVNMSCHITSEIFFLLLMVLRLILLTTGDASCDCLGWPPSPLDYVVLVWVLARIVNVIKKLREMNLFNTVANVWQLNDMASNLLFTFIIALKIYDSVTFDDPNRGYDCNAFSNPNAILAGTNMTYQDSCDRSKWSVEDSWHIAISEAALALVYLLIFVRAMEMLYTDRTFGPLQLSLDKMLLDTMRFLTIFLVTFFAFACAMTQVFWSYGRTNHGTNATVKHQRCLDPPEENSTCYPVYSNLGDSVLEQYWTLYGYGWGSEPPQATSLPGENKEMTVIISETSGQIVSMLFHLWAVVVMLNVLVAMLSHSFDRVRDNAELEWKFHRSEMWMKFIRKGIYPRPPPMNLIPSPRDLKSVFRYIKNSFKKCCCIKSSPSRHNAKRNGASGEDITSSTRENQKYREAVTRIATRYMRRYLLPDFRHDDVSINRSTGGRRGSTTIEESNA
ncbi:unnamed protein product [Clavelina lepadiformis]|uniref:Ion transport domain-containing protein n=1 Tax=Clavelina lepadiformis TaxID=159417 RepID=A0ABP0GC39_CLALP